jgi:hypothetical protein
MMFPHRQNRVHAADSKLVCQFISHGSSLAQSVKNYQRLTTALCASVLTGKQLCKDGLTKKDIDYKI